MELCQHCHSRDAVNSRVAWLADKGRTAEFVPVSTVTKGKNSGAPSTSPTNALMGTWSGKDVVANRIPEAAQSDGFIVLRRSRKQAGQGNHTSRAVQRQAKSMRCGPPREPAAGSTYKVSASGYFFCFTSTLARQTRPMMLLRPLLVRPMATLKCSLAPSKSPWPSKPPDFLHHEGLRAPCMHRTPYDTDNDKCEYALLSYVMVIGIKASLHAVRRLAPHAKTMLICIKKRIGLLTQFPSARQSHLTRMVPRPGKETTVHSPKSEVKSTWLPEQANMPANSHTQDMTRTSLVQRYCSSRAGLVGTRTYCVNPFLHAESWGIGCASHQQ